MNQLLVGILILASGLVPSAPAQQIQLPSSPTEPLGVAAQMLADDLNDEVLDPQNGTWKVNGTGTVGVEVIVDPALATDPAYELVDHGYHLAGANGAKAVVRAATMTGATNGVHGLRRRLMLEGLVGDGVGGDEVLLGHIPRPTAYDETVVPTFQRRGVMVSTPPFGGQHNRDGFGAENWTRAEWYEYLAFLRLMNATHIEVALHGLYDSTDPRTFHERRRYEILEDVLHEAHRLGLEFHLVVSASWISQGLFWDALVPPQAPLVPATPPPSALDLIGPRDCEDPNGNCPVEIPNPTMPNMDDVHDHRVPYFGNAFAFPSLDALGSISAGLQAQAEAAISSAQHETFRRFREADAIVVIWNEGGSDYSAQTVGAPTSELLRALDWIDARLEERCTDDLGQPLLDGNGQPIACPPRPRVIFWGWLHDIWHRWQLNDPDHALHPGFLPFYADSTTALMARGTAPGSTESPITEWLQESGRNYPVFPWWDASGIDDSIAHIADPLGEISIAAASAAPSMAVTNYFYWTAPEIATSLLPRPMIEETINELDATFDPPDNLSPGDPNVARKATGITGYRLSPGTRFANDYVTFRFAEDRTFTSLADTTISGGDDDGRSAAYVVLRAELAQFLSHGSTEPADLIAIAGLIDALEDGRPFAETMFVGELATIPVGERDFDLIFSGLAGLSEANGHQVAYWTMPRLHKFYYLVLFGWLTESIAWDVADDETLDVKSHPYFDSTLKLCRQAPFLRAFSSQYGWGEENRLQLSDFISRLRASPF